MAAISSQRPRLLQLAERLESDIRDRQLKVGDPYLTTAEAARMLQVNGNLANRTLQLLVQRGRIERRQRRGSCVADAQARGRVSPLARVHLVVHQRYLKAEGLLADGTIIGLEQALPGVEVQFNFLPRGDVGDFVERLVAAALRAPAPEAFVLVRAPLEAHRQIRASGLPAVVHGTVYPAMAELSSIDVDHRVKARLLVDYLAGRGHRRYALLLREALFPGDHVLIDGVMEALAGAGVSPQAIRVRSLASDRELVATTLAELLAESDEPLGVICRSQPLAEAALAAATSAPGQRCEVVACDIYGAPATHAMPYAFTRPEASAIEVGAELGHMLARQARAEPPVVERKLLSATLELPTNS